MTSKGFKPDALPDVMVIDDFIDLKYQEKIKNILFGEDMPEDYQFPWYYLEDVTASGDSDSQHRPGLSHVYVDLPYEDERDLQDGGTIKPNKVGHVISDYHELFVPFLQTVVRKLEWDQAKVLQGRSFLQFPINTDGTIDKPHIDIHGKTEFRVALYYVCDSDGDTVIYNEKVQSEKYTIKQRVTPKQGRVVIFNGHLYHTAEQPTKSNTRCIVNYNLGL